MYASSPKTKSPKDEIVETWIEIVIIETKDCRNRDRLARHHRYVDHRQTDRRNAHSHFFIRSSFKGIVWKKVPKLS